MTNWIKTTTARTDADEPLSAYALDWVARRLSDVDKSRLRAAGCAFDVEAPLSVSSLEPRLLPLFWRPAPEAEGLTVRWIYDVDHAAVSVRWVAILPSGERMELLADTSLAVTAGRTVRTDTLDIRPIRRRSIRRFCLGLEVLCGTASATTANFTVTAWAGYKAVLASSPLATFGAYDGCLVEAKTASPSLVRTGSPIQTVFMQGGPNEIYVYPHFPSEWMGLFVAGTSGAPVSVTLTRYGSLSIYSLSITEEGGSDPYPIGAFPLGSDPEPIAAQVSPGVPTSSAFERFFYVAGEYLFRSRAPLFCWGPAPAGNTTPAATPATSNRAYGVATVNALSTWFLCWQGVVEGDEGVFMLEDGTPTTRRALTVEPYFVAWANNPAPVKLDLRLRRLDDAGVVLAEVIYQDQIELGAQSPRDGFLQTVYGDYERASPALRKNLHGLFEGLGAQVGVVSMELGVSAEDATDTQYLDLAVRLALETPAGVLAPVNSERFWQVQVVGVEVRGSASGAWDDLA